MLSIMLSVPCAGREEYGTGMPGLTGEASTACVHTFVCDLFQQQVDLRCELAQQLPKAAIHQQRLALPGEDGARRVCECCPLLQAPGAVSSIRHWHAYQINISESAGSIEVFRQ